MFKKVDPKQSLPQMEEEILKFWEENKIFEKSLANRKNGPARVAIPRSGIASGPIYSFYDGPPFATGTPHYGHIVASTMKDAVPRYWTMRGHLVERKWGWDCHGLPIENIAEKELGITRKKEIEEMGVEKFNKICESKVLEYVAEWETVIRRLGRWADMKNSYRTMDLSFMESVWWVFKQLWDKGLVYEGYRSMHICPRCETTLSQSEVAEGYKNVKDLSVTAKFELTDEPETFVLAWTTTPWTLIGNVALAVNKNIEYIKIAKLKKLTKDEEFKDLKNAPEPEGYYYIAKDTFLSKASFLVSGVYKWIESHVNIGTFQVVETIKGEDLVGKKYKPLFDYYSKNEKLENYENGWKIYAGDFVTTDDGTGVVHIAPAFGEDDMNMGKHYKLPFIQHVGMDGVIKEEAGEFAGMNVKPKDDLQKTDVEIIKYLAKKDLLFSKEQYEHSYPHCWRCDTPLLNYATSSWFVSVLKVKERALELAKNINWSPKHIKEGRFGNWLEGARDWSISRQRFWASVIPIWKCDGHGCDNLAVFGSVAELEKASGQKVSDLHKHVVDKITFSCEKCGGIMKRVPDVLDTWFDSGSMPYAQSHYPFENKEKFDQSFPAQFIAEGVDQTRAWFYYLHIIATSISDSHAFKNVIVNGIVLAEDGKKMAKRLKNYPDPSLMFSKYGADVLRFYLMGSPVVEAENLNFNEREVSDLSRGMFRMLWNSYSFFTLYANVDKWEFDKNKGERIKPARNASDAGGNKAEEGNLLDKWIISELHVLIKEVNDAMENYQLNRAARAFGPFVDDLSNWYIRRSRKRFWKPARIAMQSAAGGSEDDSDKDQAYRTLYTVLVTLSKLIAPFAPFIAEEVYKNLTGEESVHLASFPIVDESMIDKDLMREMQEARNIINLGLSLRASAGIKVRQPLSELKIKDNKLRSELLDIIKEEVNVKKVETRHCLVSTEDIFLNTEITEDLKLEGMAREIIRFIQEMRKAAGYEVDNRIRIGYDTCSHLDFQSGERGRQGGSLVFDKFSDIIAKETLAEEILPEDLGEFDLEKEFLLEKVKVKIQIKKVAGSLK